MKKMTVSAILILICSSFTLASGLREKGDFGFGLNLGWNAIPAFGITLEYFISARTPIEVGLGFSNNGPKYGITPKYLFLTDPRACPYAGLGFAYSTGFDESTTDININGRESSLTGKSDAAFSINPELGLDFRFKSGFAMKMSKGYSIQFPKNTYTLIESEGDDEDIEKVIDLFFGPGIIIRFNGGWSF